MDHSYLFRIVVAYEHFTAGTRAMQMTDRLTTQLPREISIQVDPWKFELIGDSHLKEVARQSAAEADMLVIAARGNKELPDYVSEWIERWVCRDREDPVALVALPDFEMRTLDETLLFTNLRRITEQRNVDFFWHGEDRPIKKSGVPACH